MSMYGKATTICKVISLQLKKNFFSQFLKQPIKTFLIQLYISNNQFLQYFTIESFFFFCILLSGPLWQPTVAFLPRELHGERGLVG